MVIENTTVFKKEYIKRIMWANNSDDNKYKRFKLIYNTFGLVAGMMFIRYFIFDAMGNVQTSKPLMYIYAIVAAVCLYIGMYGMDRNNLKSYNKLYANMDNVKFIYNIDNTGITVADDDGDSELFEWERVVKLKQDIDNFYFFVGSEECLVVNKNGSTKGSIRELYDLSQECLAKVNLKLGGNEDE